jgi:hypothetical protein
LGAATELVDGYLAAGPLSPGEVEAAVPVLLRYRLAEKVDGLARRIAGTGATDGPDRVALDATRDAVEQLDKED